MAAGQRHLAQQQPVHDEQAHAVAGARVLRAPAAALEALEPRQSVTLRERPTLWVHALAEL